MQQRRERATQRIRERWADRERETLTSYLSSGRSIPAVDRDWAERANSINNYANNFSYSNGSNLNGLNSYHSYAASNTASTTSDKGMSNHARNSAGADSSVAAAFTLPSDGPQDRGASNNSTGAPSLLPRPMLQTRNPKPYTLNPRP